MYHAVQDDWRSPLAVPRTQFEAHCAWLKRRRRVLPLGEWQHTPTRSEEHTSELQSHSDLVCRLLLEKKKKKKKKKRKEKEKMELRTKVNDVTMIKNEYK